jgi:hypothetical protein
MITNNYHSSCPSVVKRSVPIVSARLYEINISIHEEFLYDKHMNLIESNVFDTYDRQWFNILMTCIKLSVQPIIDDTQSFISNNMQSYHEDNAVICLLNTMHFSSIR